MKKHLFFSGSCFILLFSLIDSTQGQNAEKAGVSSQIDDSNVYDQLVSSVVFIGVETKTNSPYGASGTGFIFKKNSYGNFWIMTNHHVIENKQNKNEFANDIKIIFGSRTSPQSRERLNWHSADHVIVEHADPTRDLAVLRVGCKPVSSPATKSQNPFQPPNELSFAESDVRPGQKVFSIGCPGSSQMLFNYCDGSVRQIGLMRFKRFHAKILETSNPTNFGDSGGPLFNLRGEVVGITKGYMKNARLISHFIAASEARNYIAELESDGFLQSWQEMSESAKIDLAEYYLSHKRKDLACQILSITKTERAQKLNALITLSRKPISNSKLAVESWLRQDFRWHSSKSYSEFAEEMLSDDEHVAARAFCDAAANVPKYSIMQKIVDTNWDRSLVFYQKPTRLYSIRAHVFARLSLSIDLPRRYPDFTENELKQLQCLDDSESNEIAKFLKAARAEYHKNRRLVSQFNFDIENASTDPKAKSRLKSLGRVDLNLHVQMLLELGTPASLKKARVIQDILNEMK